MSLEMEKVFILPRRRNSSSPIKVGIPLVTLLTILGERQLEGGQLSDKEEEASLYRKRKHPPNNRPSTKWRLFTKKKK
jgi:hypothetical protein